MAIVLGPNQYGKAETRVVRISRDGSRHEIRDLNVSTSLRGDFADAHIRGDQAHVLPTDSQKNTCFAYATEKGPARSRTTRWPWRGTSSATSSRSGRPGSRSRNTGGNGRMAGAAHPHTFIRAGQDVRTTSVAVRGEGQGQQAWVVSGLTDLVLLKSTGSEFAGFLKDPYTTLPETHDRIMATSLTARWRYAGDSRTGPGRMPGSGRS